jgi:hypothetical protein
MPEWIVFVIAIAWMTLPAPADPDPVPLATGPAVAETPSPEPPTEAPVALAPPAIEGDRIPESQIPTGRFTTAAEVRPILDMTRPSWIAIQQNGGQDILYFTNLLAWRCGLWEVRYGLNGAPPETILPLEPCYDDTASPNSMVDIETYPIYLTAPAGSIDSVDLEILYDDGTTDAAVYARQSVLMPG